MEAKGIDGFTGSGGTGIDGEDLTDKVDVLQRHREDVLNAIDWMIIATLKDALTVSFLFHALLVLFHLLDDFHLSGEEFLLIFPRIIQ